MRFFRYAQKGLKSFLVSGSRAEGLASLFLLLFPVMNNGLDGIDAIVLSMAFTLSAMGNYELDQHNRNHVQRTVWRSLMTSVNRATSWYKLRYTMAMLLDDSKSWFLPIIAITFIINCYQYYDAPRIDDRLLTTSSTQIESNESSDRDQLLP